MGEVVFIVGRSGTGKSTSLRDFKKGEVGILEVLGKKLPFKGGDQLNVVDLTVANNKETFACDRYEDCKAALKGNKFDSYIIDDSTYLMQLENFERGKEKGYEKFTDIALHFQQLVTAAANTSPDTIVYFMHHPSFNNVNGITEVKPATAGKMLEEKFCLEGCCNIVFETDIRDGVYGFVTNRDTAEGLAKSPMGMFDDTFIDNDLKMVDKTIREYFGMKPLGGK